MENKWAPFTSRMEWEVAKWAKMRGTGSTAFDDLLAIQGVGEALGLSYRNSSELNSIIDDEMPSRYPSFTREEVIIAGQAFDLYKRDILECIRALYGNAEHCKYMCFVPERHYADANKTLRLYHDFYTGKWWWSTQKQLEKDKPGATIVPVIISSDKTQITLFRNKSAYPVYMTIGNLPKEIRRKPSQQGQILLAYLPTSRLEHITNAAARRHTLANLFHACMSHLTAPLKEAGLEGVVMESGDGVKRRCHPLLAVYVGDYPEQILVTTGYYGDCPCCEAPKDELGNYPLEYNYRNMQVALDVARKLGSTGWIEACQGANLKPVQHPFWEDLPYCDIFRSITPDILHQLYQGVMKHLISWLTDICGADEIDARVRRLPPTHGMRIFHKGITTLSRVSGSEHKQMCSFLLGIITDVPSLSAHQSRQLLTATRALLDFLYLSCYPIHTDESLQTLDNALATFHTHKQVFVDLASNHKDEYSQMTRWLERREKVMYHSLYINWRCTIPVPNTDRAQRTLTDLQCTLHQKLTTTPTVKSVSFTKLEDLSDRGYSATHFTDALAQFVVLFRRPELSRSRIQLDEYARVVVFPFRTIPVWHRIKFLNHDLYGKETLDVASAHPRYFAANGQIMKRSQFDAVLVRIGDTGNGIKDFRIARLRVIFSLPDKKLDTLFPPNTLPPKHLAYIEWFTKFVNQEPHSGLFQVKPQKKSDGTPVVAVIPVDIIQRSVHLFPRWGGSVPSKWSSETVLSESTSFLVNVFKNNHTYFNIA
ncbi:hypothetical protein K435DRAFT_831729 [Dendrothele bispora CBS 962.96]|uniref:Uncharacterized protein n=1 Tax=Dendrothele bispora (strain CBS 962.96) TaxID=1314807 RepID=A0A4S8L139_DENBC|nr:hypothetical protein K435DRAFT_831729 [Dendrothele bispora CBS 962.96]